MKKIIYSLCVLCVILAVAAFTLLCCYLCACDGYSRVCMERNNALNQVEELKRENNYMQWQIEKSGASKKSRYLGHVVRKLFDSTKMIE